MNLLLRFLRCAKALDVSSAAHDLISVLSKKWLVNKLEAAAR
jgi:hypothetical protein